MHVANPATGLQMAGDRLEECYASPGVIIRALFERNENFPKINHKEPLKLRELGDLLRDWIQPYLKSTCLVCHIWTLPGVSILLSTIKKINNVSFPPFAFLQVFVCNEACRRNYPSFTLQTVTTGPPKLK